MKARFRGRLASPMPDGAHLEKSSIHCCQSYEAPMSEHESFVKQKLSGVALQSKDHEQSEWAKTNEVRLSTTEAEEVSTFLSITYLFLH